MNEKFKPLALEDFGLSKDELTTIVGGSQEFLGPDNDSGDNDTVDTEPEPGTS